MKALWVQGDSEAQSYYQQVAAKLEGWAKKQSHDLLTRLKRIFLAEFMVAIVIVVAVLANWESDSEAFIPIVILFCVVLLLSGLWYLSLIRRMQSLQTKATVEALGGKIDILARFIRRVRILNWVLTPIGYGYGMWAAMLEDPTEDPTLEGLLLRFGISIPLVVGLLYVFDRFYIRKVYVKVLNGYRALYERLVGE